MHIPDLEYNHLLYIHFYYTCICIIRYFNENIKMLMKSHSREKFNVTLFFALLFHIYTEKARNYDRFQRA